MLKTMAVVQISNHAREQMRERGVPEEMVMEIISVPEQTVLESPEKMIYQSIKFFEQDQSNFLVRVFVNITKSPNLVITVYRTSKIEKYWHYEN